ncbi:adhesion G protein-coupled receptor A3-like isoform X2 [Limulus polyphemus]|uniref:Adhesion G protein-coupled receptor A3-like isoform X2 n=1 Tax=Limulus polyphemus TaxID=6850 RepID=A0ABM1BAY3_LIMPO|nr:adhesion G protein-coupled receptor A3-like isoform X2 [Limulus polyphemus]
MWNLKGNDISQVQEEAFAAFHNLKKLVLKKNQIRVIEDGAFENLTSLESLDLSDNKIGTITPGMFRGLSSLQRLELGGNAISRIPEGSFKELPSLRIIGLEKNPLICDCQLWWLVAWAVLDKNRITLKSTCKIPHEFENTQLVEMKKHDMHCNWPLQLPVFELQPKTNQLVFAGDSLTFLCRVSNIEQDTHLTWIQDGETIMADPLGSVLIEQHMNADKSVIVSSLSLRQLQTGHSGSWMCHVETSRGNESLGIRIVVVAENAGRCPRTVTSDNKGQYVWPETLAGITVQLQCMGTPSGALGYGIAHAYHTCTAKGVWEDLNTSGCPYVSEVTKVLYQFSKTNLTLSKTNVVDSVNGLRNYTGNGDRLHDKMDVVFIARTLENYLEFVPEYKEIAEMLVDIINAVMNVDRRLLRAAQTEDRSCSRLVGVLRQLPELSVDTALNRYRSNLVMEEFIVKPEVFQGMACISHTVRMAGQPTDGQHFWPNSRGFFNDKSLHCHTVNISTLRRTNEDQSLDASIYLPPSLFRQPDSSEALTKATSHKLQFLVFQNSILFPRPAELARHKDITSAVITSKVAKVFLTNLTDPVYVTLTAPLYTNDITPVWWNQDINGGHGDWSHEGCMIQNIHENQVTFSCHRLGTFGLLQDLDALFLEYSQQHVQYRLSHPTIYLGSLITVCCLIVSIVVYISCFSKICMPKKNKHSLLNTWLALVLLCCLFALGVKQVDIPLVCQAIGLLLHYLTLCVLLWMVISVSNLYKKLTKSDPPQPPPDEPLPDHPLPPKPMLRFYLVGWGVATIVCGISAAVHLENYGGHSYCFLAFSPSIAAFYGPTSVLLFFLCVFLLLIRCVLQSSVDSSGPLLDNIPIASNVDTDLTHNNIDSQEQDSLKTEKASTLESTEDNEFSYHTQLRAHLVMLILFVCAWASGAVTIGRSTAGHLPADDLIFGLLYCLFSIFLGVFVLVFFCYSRQDVRMCIFKWLNLKEPDSEETAALSEVVPPVSGHDAVSSEPVLQSTNSLHSSHTSKSNNPVIKQGLDHSKPPSVNLLSSYPSATDHSFSGAEMFYDPRQSVVAKKFFEKNRRQQQLRLLKKNNLQKEAATRNSDSGKTNDPFHNQKSDSEQTSMLDGSSIVSGIPIACNILPDLSKSSVAQENVCLGQRTEGEGADLKVPSNKRGSSPKKLPGFLLDENKMHNCSLCSDTSQDTSCTNYPNIQHYAPAPSPMGIPPWLSGPPTDPRKPRYIGHKKNSCVDCSDSSRVAPSVFTHSCCSELTEGSYPQTVGHKPRSRERNRHRRNRRQRSWDDRYRRERAKSQTCKECCSVHCNQCLHEQSYPMGNMSRQRHRAGSRMSDKSRQSDHLQGSRQFTRSQSAYEQMARQVLDDLVSSSGADEGSEGSRGGKKAETFL